VSCARFPVKVRSTHPVVLSASIEKRSRDQISKTGIIINWVDLITVTREARNHERSEVVSFRRENRK
jgi:hypothetical protein